MKKKTRYNIALSERRGVKVRAGGEEDLPIFLSLYEETAKRNGIRLHSKDYFSSLFHVKEDDAIVKLLIAQKDDIHIKPEIDSILLRWNVNRVNLGS